MLRIRLRRTGKKHQPSYRVVVADQRAPRDGAFVEVIGRYNPRTEPRTLEFEAERVKYWLERGAQPSETVHRLLHSEGLIDREPPQRHTVASRAEREAEAATPSPATGGAEDAPADDGDGDAEPPATELSATEPPADDDATQSE